MASAGHGETPMRVGLIGFGAVGRRLAEAIVAGEAGRVALVAVLVRTPEKIPTDVRSGVGCLITNDAADFLATQIDLVIEVAGHDALKAYAEDVLRQGKDLLLISVGAFADAAFQERVWRTAHDRGRRVYLATGAIAGLDAIASGAVGGLESVTHFVRKPPRGLLSPEEAAEVERAGQPRELYAGPAREAALRFPESVNVTAAVSLAGIGFDRTLVRVIADPAVDRNVHQVEAEGDFGLLRFEIRNVPSESNPRTGRIVAMSIISTLRQPGLPLSIG